MALSDDLISAWELDEASGNALDSYGSSTLTDFNTVGSGTGLVYGTVRDFEADSAEALTASDSADLSTGDIDFTIEAWVQIESLATRALIGKGNGAGASTDEYVLRTVSSRFRWTVSRTSAYTDADATNFGTVSTGVWYHVVAWHDATANQVGIAVNAGTPNVASHSAGPPDTASGFAIGRYGSFAGQYWDGLIGPVRFWKRVLTSDERTELYNSGAGRTLAYITAGGGSPIPVFLNHYRQQGITG